MISLKIWFLCSVRINIKGETREAHKLLPSCPVAFACAECSAAQNSTVLLSVTGPWHWETGSVILIHLWDQVYKRFEFYLSGHLEDTKYHYTHTVKCLYYRTESVFNTWQSPLIKAESLSMSLFIKHELIRRCRKTVSAILPLSFLLSVPSSIFLSWLFYFISFFFSFGQNLRR